MVNHNTARVVMREPVDIKASADGRFGGSGGNDMMTSRSEVMKEACFLLVSRTSPVLPP